MKLHKRILAAATATLLALGMAAGGASPALAAAPDDTKVWVCKYSGTPGVNEQYKDGKNPIEVSLSTIDATTLDAETGTGYFADGQARSFSLGYSSRFTVDPTIEDCPRPQLPIPGYDVFDETCDAGGSIVLDESEWITYVVTNSGGAVIPNDQLTNLPPGTYTVTPTAVSPAILDDEFYDPVAIIDAIDPALCADLATASIAFTAATCTTGQLLNPDGFAMSNATVFSSNVIDGVYTVVFVADTGSLFAAGTGVSEDRTTLTFTGTLAGVDLSLCAVATASIDFIDPTCTTGQLLNPDGFAMSNATVFSSNVIDGVYTVVFTAGTGSLFAAGAGVSEDRTTLTFTGTLAGVDLTLCPVATASIAFTDPTCTEGELLDEDGFVMVNATVTSSNDEGGEYTVVFTAVGDALFAAGDGVSENRKTLTLSGELDPQDERLCLVVEASFALPPATCEVGEDWENPIVDADAGVIYGEPEFDPETQTVSITFTATGANIFAVEIEGEISLVKTLTVTLDVADRDPSLCDVPTYDIPVMAATCELGEILDEDGISAENAEFVVVDDGSESGTYEIEFTADDGYRFADDQKTLTVTGELAGPDTELCLEAIAAIAVTDADCFFDSVLDEEGFTAENAEFEVTVYNVETREYEVVFTADYGYRFDTSLAGVSEDGRTQTFSGTLDAADPNGDGCVLPITDASIAFVDATCLDPESLDEEGFVFDSELASLESVMYDGLDYEVVFVTIGDDTVFFQSSEPVEGRTVSEDGKVLTFTGTLDGPNEELCPDLPTAPVTTASVTWVLPDCLGNPGSFTLRSEPGVIWTVDGVVVEGNKTYTAAIGSTPSIEASLEPASEEFPTGFGWNDENQRTLWNLSFPAADDCLPTLAITGASNALSGLGMVAVLIMMAGTGLVVARRREAARIQG